MIDREFNIGKAENQLKPYIDANISGYYGFRRRAVLIYTNGKWSLLLCTVEAISNDSDKPDGCNSMSYPKVILYEDWLDAYELLDFVKQIDDGNVILGEHTLSASEEHRNWSREQVTFGNIYFNKAGHVFISRFSRENIGMYGALLMPKLPYYPDITEACRDWLPFSMYHGHSDSRNGEIILLLPETRAYLLEISADDEVIRVKVGGAHKKSLSLYLKGAWWEGYQIHHFEVEIINNEGKISIPRYASRLDFVLTDEAGTVYDYMRENNYSAVGVSSDNARLENTNLAEIVRKACMTGEGIDIEFKPFIEIDNKKRSEKLHEIFKTVASFANTKGGRIFLGISDDCELNGVSKELSKVVDGAADSVACNTYLGKLRSRIRDDVFGDPEISFKHVEVDEKLILIIEVLESKEKPVYVRQESFLYVRRGSSNMKAPPNEWRNILNAREQNKGTTDFLDQLRYK